jgi:dihydrofolate reductase
MKGVSGKDIAIFGSNELCVSLMEKDLVDEFRIMVNPIALGAGTPLFTGLSKKVRLKLEKIREFKSGNVLHYYLLLKS